MLRSASLLITFVYLTTLVCGLRYDPALAQYNLNTNRTATNPLDYSGERGDGFTYHESPPNWRFPTYTIFLDRWVNGDPDNDNANGTIFEQDMYSNQLRHGGDLQGLVDSLDYIQGMGIKAIYIAGSIFINQPWGSDSYSPLDMTLLDAHFGTIAEWQSAIDEIHARGMYVILDHTMATMGDLIGFTDYLNSSTPFNTKEYTAIWKSGRQYQDFSWGNTYNETCRYPQFWLETGYPVGPDVTSQLQGCYDSDFDQYGDIEAFGVYPDWQRQLAKFASVQDRLRDWHPPVRSRIELFTCMVISTLDIDGFRVDKGAQVSVEGQAAISTAIRKCALKYNKKNFFVPGEITSGNTLGSIYMGRGRRPDMRPPSVQDSLSLANATDTEKYFLRPEGESALDAGAFHYSIYRFLTRFLGLDGNLEAGFDLPFDWVEAWNIIMLTNDLYNANNGEFDPRHMYGVTNQDVFRWPGIDKGIERQMLGYFITTMLMPGIPLMYYGEEQAFYVLDSTALNYVYGRQAMSAAQAWKLHGCYTAGSSIYVDWPVTKSRTGCLDDTVTYDHRDPSHPIRNILKHMFDLRARKELNALNDGWYLGTLAKKTSFTKLRGSSTATEFGIWSVARAKYHGIQSDSDTVSPVWLVYHNQANETDYIFDCGGAEAFIAPFDAGVTVKNLFAPYDEIPLVISRTRKSGFSGNPSGCINNITMRPYAYAAYVPLSLWEGPKPMITKFTPGHDVPIHSEVAKGTVAIGLHFSEKATSCDAITQSITIASTVEGTNSTAKIDPASVSCSDLNDQDDSPYEDTITGTITSKYAWTANLVGVADGIHSITVKNVTTATGSTGTTDKFLIRVGLADNPVVFPPTANYSNTVLATDSVGSWYVNHRAPGATKWRYSTNWGSTWSEWLVYKGGLQSTEKISPQGWSGARHQAWEGRHIMVQYFSAPLGSSSFIQHGDDYDMGRRFPHLFLQGPFNKWGYDSGVPNQLKMTASNTWELHYMDEWPSMFQFNVWGINPDNQPDQSWVFGNIIGNGVANRLPPPRLPDNVFNITAAPPMPALSFRLVLNDATYGVQVIPQGNMWYQIALFIILATVPLIMAVIATWAFFRSFYRVKVNKRGFRGPGGIKAWLWPWEGLPGARLQKANKEMPLQDMDGVLVVPSPAAAAMTDGPSSALTAAAAAVVGGSGPRRTILLATMEYNIDDWNIVIRIGGLGVMAKLMSTALSHLDIIWVVPCVGDIHYPVDTPAEPMYVTVLGQQYTVYVQYHRPTSPPGNNITYVILDAPIFRQQTKFNPYHARMDDIESAILYATWNSCIAETMRRFPQIDIYHMNDYHGAAAPLYLIQENRTIPCCLSLHNAEFQGMWNMRTPEETKEVCDVFGLSTEIVKTYVQYGSAFNLLHAGASYLRLHQHGFGAVGVSKKYGDRSLARYPIFWALKTIGHLPNPDPNDTAEWTAPILVAKEKGDIKLHLDPKKDREQRQKLRVQAQEWAGLDINPEAELFIFAGRWSLQKGVDLIADIFPSVLEKCPQAQLICVGPVIDLHGKFAALKLSKVAEMYPGRVFYRSEFTALPPFVFGGAEFALIPSRDEPFGLVAVESGRQGALGVGARVGGLGQMPGFWYTVESTSPRHLLTQFRKAIWAALESTTEQRAMMRAWSAKQRFPVAQWVQRVNELHNEAIRIHKQDAEKRAKRPMSLASMHMPAFMSSGALASRRDSDSRPGSAKGSPRPESFIPSMPPSRVSTPFMLPHPTRGSPSEESAPSSESLSINGGYVVEDDIIAPAPPFAQSSFSPNRNSSGSTISLQDVVGDRHDLKLQKVDPFFTDGAGEFYTRYEQKLDNLTVGNSQGDMCIAAYLKRSEKEWFTRYREAKLGLPRAHSTMTVASTTPDNHSDSVVDPSEIHHDRQGLHISLNEKQANNRTMLVDDEFLLGDEYKPPTGLKKILSTRIFRDWPVYSLLLAGGQVISANSYQIVLLTGETGQSSQKLYIVAGTYIASSLFWWFMVRRFKSVYALSLPWLFYGFAFLLLGIASFVPGYVQRGQVQDAATVFYAVAASSGALDFSLNFGDESGAPTNLWAVRALIITAFAQLYSAALWYWGSLMTNPFHPTGSASGNIGESSVPKGIVIAIPIAIVLWAVGLILFWGLPDYYRQSPETIPGYYLSLFRRRTVPWFFIMVVLQNYWLSVPYGRSWEFLFVSRHVPGWAIFLLTVLFFVVLWSCLIWVFTIFSNKHPWLLPIFATGLGLGAPRWAQTLWGTSGIGLYLPWAGGPVASAILSRCLWLWLGLLDTIQIVGLGMTLLATLTRQHVMGVLIGAQVIGGVTTMVAKATSPNAGQPTATFPDFSEGAMPGLGNKFFWLCLVMQLVIPFGFFKFFRKEQVTKP
ncbi:alpha-1,3-glucan synthase-like protein [Bombardia bombarda]|uniref:alpha-1,3-glucan synthase n=1 Tax=Bombardia bombarda TaxID=252184 RepID=A0AA39X079_9PEZI|nr:alpha-1,3-glucan synthase-like protein [Bombardia bombarda]